MEWQRHGMTRVSPRRALFIALGGLLTAMLAGSVVAQVGPLLLNRDAGGTQASVIVVRQDGPSIFGNAIYMGVPGAQAPVSVQERAGRLVIARFTAESACYNLPGSVVAGVGTVRIIAVDAKTGNTVELFPRSGGDFAFDSSASGRETPTSWEGHAMERSIRLGPGTYRIVVQAAVNDPAVRLRLDDWSFSVQQSL